MWMKKKMKSRQIKLAMRNESEEIFEETKGVI